MKLLLARAVLRSMAWLPLPLIRLLATGSGWFVWLLPGPLFRRQKQRINAHLQLVFPDQPSAKRSVLLRKNLIEMLSTTFESGPVWYRSGEWLQQHFQVNGWHHLEQARRSGRGLLIVGGHLGNWEAGALYMTLRFPMLYLYKAPRSAAVDRLLSGRRARFGGRFIQAGSPALRQLLSHLRSSGVAGLLFDQLPKAGDSVMASFFDQPVETMTLVHRLARRTGCTVLFADSCRRAGGRGWELRIGPVSDRFAELDPEPAAALLNRALEQRIGEVPEQYLWQYRRFQANKMTQTE